MRALFNSKNYQDYLQILINQLHSERGFQTKLAKAMSVQAAYLSQVLKGKADLNEDQAIALCHFIDFTDLETEYFLLLVRLSRAGTSELRVFLEDKMKKIQGEYQEIYSRVPSKQSHLSAEDTQRYFATWIPSTLHTATSSNQYQTVEKLAERLDLDTQVVKQTLKFLSDVGLVTHNENRYEFSGKSLHFTKQISMNQTIQISRRLQAIKSIEKDTADDLHFSSVFTIDKKTLTTLRELFLEVIESSHKEIHSSGTEELYAMCIDLFEVV